MYNRERLMKVAPAIFAKEPASTVSDKYTFVPTYNILDLLKDYGYYIVSAEQPRMRSTKSYGLYSKHLVRLRHEDYKNFTGTDIPEILLINSHNGKNSLGFFFGIFRLICENGLIISSLNLMSFKSKHIHFEYETFKNVIDDYMNKTDDVLGQIDRFSNIQMSTAQRMSFAKKAKNIIWPDGSLVPEEMLIKPRREEDDKGDLYTVFNVVQENAMKGAISYNTPKRKVKTKEVKSIDRKLRVNLGLWELAESYAN